MHLNDQTSCCAITELDGLSDHDTPLEAMRAFCRLLTRTNSFSSRTTFSINNVGAFYIFSGVEKYLNDPPDYDEDDDWYGDQEPVGYASAFAAFIKENKLGTLRGMPAQPNRVNHPDHMVRVYLWAPDPKALKEWYKINRTA